MALTNAEKQARHRARLRQRLAELEAENRRLKAELRRHGLVDGEDAKPPRKRKPNVGS